MTCCLNSSPRVLSGAALLQAADHLAIGSFEDHGVRPEHCLASIVDENVGQGRGHDPLASQPAITHDPDRPEWAAQVNDGLGTLGHHGCKRVKLADFVDEINRCHDSDQQG